MERFHLMIYVFGAFLILTGIRMALGKEKRMEPDKNPVLKAFRRLVPVTSGLENGRFFTRRDGRLWATPLFVALLTDAPGVGERERAAASESGNGQADLRRQKRQVEALRRCAEALFAHADADAIVREAVVLARQMLDADAALLYLREPAGPAEPADTLRVRGADGPALPEGPTPVTWQEAAEQIRSRSAVRWATALPSRSACPCTVRSDKPRKKNGSGLVYLAPHRSWFSCCCSGRLEAW